MGLRDVDLLKLDVEGAELEVIAGMKRYLPKHIVGEYRGARRIRLLNEMLHERGYKVTWEPHTTCMGVFYTQRI